MFQKNSDSSTARLLQLCGAYFIFYVITGISVKFFLSTSPGRPALDGMEYLLYGTGASTILATGVAIILKWYKMDSIKRVKFLGMNIPSEYIYIIPSGICTAVVIPTTTLMYSFKAISVMVAMVLMRGAVIIISRIIDTIQIKQGILKKKVYKEENIAVIVALAAVALNIIKGTNDGKQSAFSSLPVMIIFISYITAYAIRIYIMNYYKNTRPKCSKKDNNKAFFAVEQFTSTTVLFIITAIVIILYAEFGVTGERITPFAAALVDPRPACQEWWLWACIFGGAYGILAFFSVFIFMFKGRTATFSSLANRLTSLIAGTVSTLLFAIMFGGKYPSLINWLSFALIILAVGFMTKAEKKRAKELAMEKAC